MLCITRHTILSKIHSPETSKFQTSKTKLKNPVHHQRYLTRAITLGVSVAVLLVTITPSCSKSKKESKKEPPEKAEKSVAPKKGKEKGKEKTTFQALDILPEGSILRSVRFPRYDKDFNPLSLFSADTLTVLDGHRIQAEGITMEMYGKDGNVEKPTIIKMNRAIYTQKHGTQEYSILKASEAVLIKGPTKEGRSEPSFIASGTGLILDLDSGRGFLLGPASTLFQIEQSDSSKKPDPSEKPAQTPALPK